MKTYVVALFTFVYAFCVLPASAMIIDGGSTEENDRFANHPAFIADQFELSGVAINNNSRWLTMLSENVYISAHHYRPAAGSSVTFYEGNDPSGPTTTRTVSSTRQQVGNTDLFLGTIDSPLSSVYNYYDFATEDINSSGDWLSSSYNGDNAYVFGKSPNSWPTSQNMAVGRNVLDRFFLGATDNTRTGDAIGATYGDAGDVSYETMLESGDSGGPLFVDDGAGNLKLVGVNWFIDDSNTEDFFGATYLGNYDTEVQSFIDTYTIPEPVTLIPLLLVSAFLALSRRR